jgi:hypothetical protein
VFTKERTNLAPQRASQLTQCGMHLRIRQKQDGRIGFDDIELDEELEELE